ncbi:Activator of Hsp90 ATPase homolog 1-like protein [Aromatoleum tolulyticum]|uniref:Activator of Hsp90 ATPase homolog 1-like protein n=1 Tax=Aromatoleum tolulyticum TaxID=34027 RepID=A0A1N7BY51_9RHOO|nr:SRPBCC domain-containing protein [Aromatoleum tolulyticum]SIR56230.1 Activator of Hsp90 ATPase homolog 1-like protein [Aromatoleum tolulyticum]
MLAHRPQGGGTLYGARVVHGTPEDCRRHAAMGFEEGWGKALDQLIEFMQARRS